MIDSIKKQVSGLVLTNKITTLVTIGLIVLFIALAVWFYKKYVIPSLNEDAYIENSVYGSDGGGNVVVYFFYTEWCPHCKKAKPQWNSFTENNPNNTRLTFKEIDCDKDKETASNFNVTSYPTIKLTYKGKTYDYDARVDKDTLQKFVETSINN